MKAKVCKNCGQITDMRRGPAKGPFKLWSGNCKEVNGCIPGEFEEVEVDMDATCIRCGNNVDYIKGIWVDPLTTTIRQKLSMIFVWNALMDGGYKHGT